MNEARSTATTGSGVGDVQFDRHDNAGYQSTGYYASGDVDTIHIGLRDVEYRRIAVGQVDVLALHEDVRDLRKIVEQQENTISDMRELVHAMWYHPGMPGAQEATDKFAHDIKNL